MGVGGEGQEPQLGITWVMGVWVWVMHDDDVDDDDDDDDDVGDAGCSDSSCGGKDDTELNSTEGSATEAAAALAAGAAAMNGQSNAHSSSVSLNTKLQCLSKALWKTVTYITRHTSHVTRHTSHVTRHLIRPVITPRTPAGPRVTTHTRWL